MDAERFAAAIFRGSDAIGNGAHAIVEERRVDKARPDVKRVDQVTRKPAEAPGFIGAHDERFVVVQETVIKIDDTAHKFGRKDADATVIEEIDTGRLGDILAWTGAARVEYRVV